MSLTFCVPRDPLILLQAGVDGDRREVALHLGKLTMKTQILCSKTLRYAFGNNVGRTPRDTNAFCCCRESIKHNFCLADHIIDFQLP